MGGSDNNPGDFDPERERIFVEAAEWYAKAIDHRLSKADQSAFEAWLKRDPRHAEAYTNAERLWARTGELPEAKARKRKKKRGVTRRDLGKAALALGFTGAAWSYLSDFPLADFRTASGERRRISAPDGTQIDLAARTRLSLAFDTASRRVILHEGEAFFSVAAEDRPFMVAAGQGVTTALGTAFGIRYRDDQARLVVTEHSVRLAVNGGAAELRAGSEVRYARAMGPIESANLDEQLGWLDGRLVFKGTPLGEVVAALNVWRKGRLVVMDRALAQRPVTFIVHVDDLADIGVVLERTLPVRLVQITPFLIFVLPA
jgi:transmembrane sensor